TVPPPGSPLRRVEDLCEILFPKIGAAGKSYILPGRRRFVSAGRRGVRFEDSPSWVKRNSIARWLRSLPAYSYYSFGPSGAGLGAPDLFRDGSANAENCKIAGAG